MRRRERGFTLLEVVLTLAIVGMLLTIAFGSLRVAMAAWRQGDERVDAHQHSRAIAFTLGRALGAAYAYRGTRGLAPDQIVLFRGTDRQVEFVTQAPPLPLAAPIAFTAVAVSLEDGESRGLVVRERALPNRDPFTDAPVVLRDPAVTSLAFRFMNEDGDWSETWDAQDVKTIPRAVEVRLSTREGGRVHALPPITVSLRTAPVK